MAKKTSMTVFNCLTINTSPEPDVQNLRSSNVQIYNEHLTPVFLQLGRQE